ncbi:DUF7285 family protein [Haloarcula litorea]|uniref:DUF7285 family protein n=1 Tax=Haloarcula litorea TaxID=3032579 RepID=UPI0023E8FB63|nr:hypothetical protein [Halomicroarcula sp. GDY20]
MSRSSARAATEPLAALVAVAAVTTGLTLYAGVLDTAFGAGPDRRNVAEPTADGIEQRLTTAGVVHPARVRESLAAVPAGYEGNVTISGPGRWSAGPEPPAGAATERRPVSVAIGPATVRRGTLAVRVWR